MATAIFDVSVRKVGKDFVELSVKELHEGGLFLEPSLVARILSSKLGYEKEEFYDRELVKTELPKVFLSFSVIQTKKNEGIYKIGLSPENLENFAKGDSWESYDYASEDNIIVGISISGDNKVCITGYHSNLLPLASAATLESFSAKGFGVIKKWLSHPNLVGVGASTDSWWTAGGNSIKKWNKTGAKVLEEITSSARITAFGASGENYFYGTDEGEVLNASAEVIVKFGNPVAHIDVNNGHIIASSSSGELAVGNDKAMGLVSVPTNVESAFQIAINGKGEWGAANGQLSGFMGKGIDFEIYEEVAEESMSFANIYDFQKMLKGREFFTQTYQTKKIYAVNMDTGSVTEKAKIPFLPHLTRLSEDGRSIFIGKGSPNQEIAIIRDGEVTYFEEDGLYQIGMSPSAEPVFSPNGNWLAIDVQKENYYDGHVSVIDTQTGTKISLPHPNSGYEYINDLVFLDNDRLWVGYSNHNSCVWNIQDKEIVKEFTSSCELKKFGEVILEEIYPDKINCWKNGEVISTFEFPSARVVDASQDGQFVLTIYENLVLHQQGKEPWTLKGKEASVSNNGNWLAILLSEEDSVVERYSLKTRELVRSYLVGKKDRVFVEDDGSVYVMDTDEIVIYDPEGNEKKRIIPSEPKQVKKAISNVFWHRTKEKAWILTEDIPAIDGICFFHPATVFYHRGSRRVYRSGHTKY